MRIKNILAQVSNMPFKSERPPMPPVTRRVMVIATGTVGASLLSGCETKPLMKSINEIGGEVASTWTRSNKDKYKDRLNTPEMMQTALDLHNAAGSGRLIKFRLKEWQKAIADHDIEFDKFQHLAISEKTLEMPELVEFWGKSIVPMLREGYQTLSMLEPVRGAKSALERLDETTYKIPPGMGIKLNYQGRCMDPTMPAPGYGELIDFQHINMRIAKKLRPVFKALCKWYSKTKDPSGQTLTWMIMSAGDPDGMCKHLNQEQFNKLQLIYPDGGKILIDYHNSNVALVNLVNKGLEKIIPGMNNVNMKDSAVVDHAAEQHLNRLIAEGVKDRGSGQPGYNMLAPTITSKSVGDGVLSVDATIFNAGGYSVIIDTTDYIGKPRRHRQSISPVPGKEVKPVLASISIKPSEQEVNNAIAETRYRLKRNEDLYKMLLAKGLDITNILMASPAASWIAGQLDNKAAWAKLIGAGATMLPFVGNALSLYEALTGKSWLTNDDLTAGSRIGSIIGSIPGAQVLKGMAKIGAGYAKTEKLGAEAIDAMSRWAINAGSRQISVSMDHYVAGYFKDTVSWAMSNTNIIPTFTEKMQNGWIGEKLFSPLNNFLNN